MLDPGRSRQDWSARSEAEALEATHATAAGLSEPEARTRLGRDGANTLPDAAQRGPLASIAGQFRERMILVLLAAAVLSILVGEAQDAAVILAIVVLNAVIGAVQEQRAERAVRALRALAVPRTRVRRDGVWTTRPSEELVVGDRVRFEAGDVVTADARLGATTDLEVDEAALTGESVPVAKHSARIRGGALAVGDRANLLHRGTLVTRGRGEGVVVATGSGTELGHVADLLASQERARTPLQVRLARFSGHVTWVVLGVCVLVFGLGVLRGEPADLMVLTAVSLGVAAIPEALPAVVSVSLALGARRMVRREALVRRLPAVETLGSVTFVCADKTGTLTEGRMRVVGAWDAGGRHDQEGRLPEAMARAAGLANESREGIGDPTDVALAEAAAASGFDRAQFEVDHPPAGDAPFDARRRRMSAAHEAAGGLLVSTKGAPEAVLERCPDADPGLWTARAEALADEGLRVLAVASRVAPADLDVDDEDTLEQDLTFLGLVALLDPPRPAAAEAVSTCRSAGISPVMITGDHPATARAIAARIGICGPGDEVVAGPELAALDDATLASRVEHIRVHARMSPEQKIRIVRALQARGQYVAMTGDGVNDAPALQAAEIGVAMGRSGTDVAREAADMVLLDDDFATVVAAVREGRRVDDNVRKFLRYTLTSNAGEIWTLLVAPFLGLPLPLLPIQILWINLVTDGLPGLALGAEPEEREVMRRRPRPPGESLFAHGLGPHVLWCGALIGALSLGALAWARAAGSESWRTVVFTVLTMCQLAHVLAIRSDRDGIWVRGFRANRSLALAVLGSVALQLAVVYWGPLQRLLHTSALSARELAVCLGLPVVVLLAVELEKALRRRRSPA